MISNVEHLFTYLLAICISSLEKNVHSVLLSISEMVLRVGKLRMHETSVDGL